MRGASTGASAHGSGCAQSKSDGHSTLKENSIDDSTGSKLSGGWLLPGLSTSANV